ncbi:MAG: FAD-dependent monooxygenase [Blastocatellia bacterium]|nr:FAD-dependent monooxygenase [Blastocatellia bacterium]
MLNDEFDVAVLGCGPTGVVLTNLLGLLGVRVVVLEREREVYPVPRATHIDEETLRNFQATGLMEELLPHTSPFGTIEVADESGKVLLRDRVADPTSPHGYAGSRFFDQSTFERILRKGLERFPSVELRTGVEATSVHDDGEYVVVGARGDAGDILLRAKWVVGCEGGRSVTREAIGASMESVAPRRPWLIADTLLRNPADATLLPDGFRYVLANERLTIYAHGFGLNRRWEFQLAEGEDAPSRETVISWISAFIDPARLEILRVVPYAHTSLLASSWRKGRIFIAGDAAHMMPPSAGQGMCSGVRDAVNLAWKLHRVISGAAGETLLDTYEQERSPHVREILLGTLFIGNRLLGDSLFQRWRRRQTLRVISSVPPVREYARKRGLRRPQLRGGFLDTSSPLAGRFFPQFETDRGGVCFRSDDDLGYRFARFSARQPRLDERIAHWMRQHGVDWVVVRPDRYVYAAGKGELTGFQDLQD